MTCPVCSTESEGRFCPECGAALKDVRCASCGAQLVEGARYCTQCGQPTFGSGPSRLPWIVAGAAIAAVAVLLITRFVGGEDEPAAAFSPTPAAAAGEAAPFAGSAGGSAGGAPQLSADPRENADRLFNRIMTEREAGNTQQAQFFLPMAIDAYGMAEPLDDDGVYHLALLQSAAGRFADARQTAERILERNPQHLLALAVAGEAMLAAGDTAQSRRYYRRFLDAYDAEKEKVYPEYIDHGRILPEYLEQARAVAGS